MQTIAKNIISYYRSFGGCEVKKKVFLSIVASDLGVSHDSVVTKAQHLVDLHANVSCCIFLGDELKALGNTPHITLTLCICFQRHVTCVFFKTVCFIEFI